jgi:hypothetical protein
MFRTFPAAFIFLKKATEIRCMSWVKLLQLVAEGSTQIERKIPSAGFVMYMLC